MKRALVRALRIGLGPLALVLGGVGFVHTSAGRPLLRAVTNMAHGGCPFGYDKPMSAVERERAQLSFAKSHRGDHRAASRPALGFVLDHTTRNEIVGQLAKFGVTCKSSKGMADLACNGVPNSALEGASSDAPARNLWLTFGTKQQLLSLIAVSRDAGADAISSAFIATREALDHEAGTATHTNGNADPHALSEGALHQASAEFRFTDYYALMRATNLGKDFMLTEEYRSLPD